MKSDTLEEEKDNENGTEVNDHLFGQLKPQLHEEKSPEVLNELL